MKKFILFISLIIPTLILALDKAQLTPIPSYRTGSPNYFQENTDPVKICALRVSFPSDDNPATTGDGKFLLSADTTGMPCTEFMIDRPPHNRAYFKDHIRAVANYYNHVSHGHAIIDTANSEIFPLSDSLTFQVSDSMDYYHPFLEEDSIDARLVELFHEAILLADSAVDFSKYDVVVMFHAGVGQDFSLFLDPTPYDIPSAFLNIKDFRKYLGNNDPNYKGILVDGKPIDSGIILPETQNHLLFENWEEVFGQSSTPCEYQIGLNGTFAFMMGFFWGLPSLYDTETGETGIGKFGLMDQGSSNLNGLFPAVPSAWERIKLEWEEPAVAGIEGDIELQHVESGSDTLVWKVPINDYEYFLVENRCAEFRPGVSFDSLQYRLYLESGEDDWPSIFPLIEDSLKAEFSEETGVLLSVPRYDVGLPGSGLLIWHIDESVIQPNLVDNRININKERRGVDLEEGDGAQDLGYESQMLFANPDIGWFFDPWFAGNEGFFHLNPDYPTDEEKRVGFTDFTNPSSKSNDFAHTGISIDSIGPAGEVMSFKISRDISFGNYPISLHEGLNTTEPLIVDLDTTDNSKEFIIISDSIYIYDNHGNLKSKTKHTSFSPSEAIIHSTHISKIGGKSILVSLTSINSGDLEIFSGEIKSNDSIQIWATKKLIPNTILTSNPLVLEDKVLFGSENSETQVYSLIEYDLSGSFTSLPVESPIIKLAGKLDSTFAVSGDGWLYHISASPFEIIRITLPEGYSLPLINGLVAGYINTNDSIDVVLSSEEGIYILNDALASSKSLFFLPLENPYPNMALSDIDGDERVEIIVEDSSKVYAFNDRLLPEPNFPITIPNEYGNMYFDGSLLISDINGDGVLDILTNIPDVGAIAYDNSGRVIRDYPRSSSNLYSQSATILNSGGITIQVGITADRKNIAATVLSDQDVSPEGWICLGGNPARNYFYNLKSTQTSITAKSLLDYKKVFNYPNPVKGNTTNFRYFLNKRCEISIDIYDLAGDFVDSFKDSNPTIGDYNEIEWDVSNVESGVYFAVVKATSGNTIDSKIVKVMIIK